MSSIKRFNIRMGQDLYDWVESKADELGVPTSSLMVFIMDEYRRKHDKTLILSRHPEGRNVVEQA